MLYMILFSVIALNCMIVGQFAKEKKFNLEIRQIVCSNANPRLIKRMGCSYEQLAPSRYVGKSHFILNQQVDKTVDAHVKIHMGTDRRIVKFLDFKFNICDALKSGISIPLVRKLLTLLLEGSNYPRKCLVKANILYNASNVRLDDTHFPNYTPYPKNFNYSLDIFVNQKQAATIRIMGGTVAKVKN